MRVVILTVGSRGDVQPFLSFGAGLQAVGHRVRICTHPGFQGLVEGQGLEFAPLAAGTVSRRAETDEGRRWAEHSSRWMPAWIGLIRDARSIARRRLRDAAAGCEGADVIVASNLTQLLGWQLSVELRVPLVRTLLNAPSYWMARRSSPLAAKALRQVAWLAARPWLNTVRRDALGLSPLPLREPIGTLDREGQLVLYPFSPVVFPKPGGWGPATEVTGYWFLDKGVDPQPTDALRVFLEAGSPPVYVGFGIQIDHDPPRTTAVIVEALRRAGRRGVLQRPPEALAGAPLGDDVLAIEGVRHEWLFPRCSAVVHHGASGTTATALRAGVPSVIVPHNSDQFSWGRRMAELGASPPPIPRRRLSVERLQEAITSATTDRRMRDRTDVLTRRIRDEDGVARAVEVFERHVGHGSKQAAVRSQPRATPRRRRQTRVLPSGLRVHGATPGDARSQHFIDGYFEGGLELRSGMTVFDVGANIGLFSLEVLRRTGGDVELYAFEPAAETFEYLNRNVEELFPAAPVRLFRAALGDQRGEATLYHRPRASVTSSLYREAIGDTASLVRGMLREPPDRYRNLFPSWLRGLPPQQRAWILRALARWSQAEVVETTCPVTTVSQVVEEHCIDRIDFLKVDVEAAELDVLRGIRAEDWAKIDRLAVEVHDVDGRVQAMRAILRSAGFTEIHVDQEWPFQGTDIYMLHAARTASGAEPVAALTATDERDASRRNDESEENHA
jgi:sterol 3beta-glucosyltransferase